MNGDQDTRTTAVSAHHRRRRRYWVDPHLQVRYVGLIVGCEGLALAVIAWAVFVVIWQPLLEDLKWGALGHAPREVFAQSVQRVTITTLAVFVLFGVVCAALGLLASHAVAGPLVRLKRALRAAWQEERFDHRVRLRHSDGLHDFADELNALLDTLEERQRCERVLLERVGRVVGDLNRTLQRGEAVADDVLEETQELEGLIHRAAVSRRPTSAGRDGRPFPVSMG